MQVFSSLYGLETCTSKGYRDNNTIENLHISLQWNKLIYSTVLLSLYILYFYIKLIPGILLYSKKGVCGTGQSPFPARMKP